MVPEILPRRTRIRAITFFKSEGNGAEAPGLLSTGRAQRGAQTPEPEALPQPHEPGTTTHLRSRWIPVATRRTAAAFDSVSGSL